MSATTEPNKRPAHHPSPNVRFGHKPHLVFLVGGIVFFVAWAVWNFWFAELIARG